jgi:hypothetical protein
MCRILQRYLTQGKRLAGWDVRPAAQACRVLISPGRSAMLTKRSRLGVVPLRAKRLAAEISGGNGTCNGQRLFLKKFASTAKSTLTPAQNFNP